MEFDDVGVVLKLLPNYMEVNAYPSMHLAAGYLHTLRENGSLDLL